MGTLYYDNKLDSVMRGYMEFLVELRRALKLTGLL